MRSCLVCDGNSLTLCHVIRLAKYILLPLQLVGEKVHLSVEAREHWTLQLTCTYAGLLVHTYPPTHSLSLSCQVSLTKEKKDEAVWRRRLFGLTLCQSFVEEHKDYSHHTHTIGLS